jgi:hypothetical protein
MTETTPLSGGNNMDKEMEKKRAPTQSRGRKGKSPTERNAPPDMARPGAVTPAENGHFLVPAEFNARVARKAYELFERRGGETGNDVEDWLTAEQLVKEEIAGENS